MHNRRTTLFHKNTHTYIPSLHSTPNTTVHTHIHTHTRAHTYTQQYMAQSAAAGLQDDPVLKALSPQALQRAREVDGPSYIDVEPWTGKRGCMCVVLGGLVLSVCLSLSVSVCLSCLYVNLSVGNGASHVCAREGGCINIHKYIASFSPSTARNQIHVPHIMPLSHALFHPKQARRSHT